MKYISLFIFCIILGCKGEIGPAGSILTGNIKGTVILYADSTGNQMPDASGVTVLIEPSNISGISVSDGNWQVVGVPAGIISLKFSKPGFFNVYRYNFQFVGGGTYYYYTTSLSEIPSVTVSNFQVSVIDSNIISFNGQISSPSTIYRNVGVVVSKSPFDTDIPFEFDATIHIYMYPDSINFSYQYYIYQPSFLRGRTVYMAAFVAPNNNSFASWDPSIERYRFDTPGVTFSQIKTVAVP